MFDLSGSRNNRVRSHYDTINYSLIDKSYTESNLIF